MNIALEYLILTFAIGYWAWVLVDASVAVWVRNGLADLRDELAIRKLENKWWYWPHRIVNFYRDMMNCPFCTAFHLAEIGLIGIRIIGGHWWSVLPSAGFAGEIATWFALSGTGGMFGMAIGYLTGGSWHHSDTEREWQFELRQGHPRTNVYTDR